MLTLLYIIAWSWWMSGAIMLLLGKVKFDKNDPIWGDVEKTDVISIIRNQQQTQCPVGRPGKLKELRQ